MQNKPPGQHRRTSMEHEMRIISITFVSDRGLNKIAAVVLMMLQIYLKKIKLMYFDYSFVSVCPKQSI